MYYKPKRVHVAGPLFSDAEREYLERMVEMLASTSYLDAHDDFFLPHRDGMELGKGPSRKDVFYLDIHALEDASVVVALLDGQDVDSGTCVELGYAYAMGKKMFGLLTDFRSYRTDDQEPHRPNLMVWGVCENGATLYHHLVPLSMAFATYMDKEGG